MLFIILGLVHSHLLFLTFVLILGCLLFGGAHRNSLISSNLLYLNVSWLINIKVYIVWLIAVHVFEAMFTIAVQGVKYLLSILVFVFLL